MDVRASPLPVTNRHARWVRACHWIIAASAVTLGYSGFVVLMSHPRLYWGEAGNDLTTALVELPISRNYKHGGWRANGAFADLPSSPQSASRTYEIFNENGWGRSLHFLAAWMLVVTGAAYTVAGVVTGHVRRDLLPRLRASRGGDGAGGVAYDLRQRLAYSAVAFVALPLMTATGLAMSPAITAAYPFLAGVFGGSQSARTIHFVVFVALAMFVIVHVAMVVVSGFGRQIRAMTWGS